MRLQVELAVYFLFHAVPRVSGISCTPLLTSIASNQDATAAPTPVAEAENVNSSHHHVRVVVVDKHSSTAVVPQPPFRNREKSK